MMMKKFLLILLGGLLAASLASCAGDGNVEEDTDGIIEEDRESGKVEDTPAPSESRDTKETDTGLARGLMDELTR